MNGFKISREYIPGSLMKRAYVHKIINLRVEGSPVLGNHPLSSEAIYDIENFRALIANPVKHIADEVRDRMCKFDTYKKAYKELHQHIRWGKWCTKQVHQQEKP